MNKRLIVACASLLMLPGVGNAAPAKHVDIEVSLSASATEARVGDEIAYEITVTNTGPKGAAADVVVTDDFGGAELLTFSASRGSCSAGSDTFSCSVGEVEPRGSVTVWATVRTSQVGTLTNSASATTASPESATTNNSTSVQTSVQPEPTPDPTSPERVTFCTAEAKPTRELGVRQVYNGPYYGTGAGPSFACDSPFYLESARSLTLRLLPGSDFYGEISAWAGSRTVSGVFAAGELISGSSEITFDLGPDTYPYHLVVEAGYGAGVSAGGMNYTGHCRPGVPTVLCFPVPVPHIVAGAGSLGALGHVEAEVVAN